MRCPAPRATGEHDLQVFSDRPAENPSAGTARPIVCHGAVIAAREHNFPPKTCTAPASFLAASRGYPPHQLAASSSFSAKICCCPFHVGWSLSKLPYPPLVRFENVGWSLLSVVKSQDSAVRFRTQCSTCNSYGRIIRFD
jgi:hypothetical protein